MTAVLAGLALLVAGFFFEKFSARQHRVLSALYGGAFCAVVAVLFTAETAPDLRTAILVAAPVAGVALMSWLLVTGICLGGILMTVALAYFFSFVLPLPIPTLYWGYATLIVGICAVWKKHLAAQILECFTAGLFTAAGALLLWLRSFDGFFSVFADPTAHLTANAVFAAITLIVAVGCAVYRIKTNRVEEVK